MNYIEKAQQLKSELDTLRPLSKDNEARIFQKFKLDWNYHSNHIEGNSLTYGETKALILFGITAQGKPLKDHLEIAGHDEAIKWIMDVIHQELPLTEKFIRELHQLILKEPYEVDAITPEGNYTKKKVKIGEYKTTPNHVKTKTGEIFRFASPEETPAKMKDLIDWYRKTMTLPNFNAILVAAEFHYKFIRIHPFDDGNGRTARILMNFILLQNGYPPAIIKTDDKANYFSVLQQADAGIFEPFVAYIAKNVVDSLEIMLKGAKGKSIEEPDDIEKEIFLLESKLKSLSQPIEVSKSREAILNIYDDSVQRLATTFIAKGELLEKFYVESKFYLLINHKGDNNNDKLNAYKNSREKIDDNTVLIDFEFRYFGLRINEPNKTDYHSHIKLLFGETRYQVVNQELKFVIEKLYTEQLSDDEIATLVNMEIRRHNSTIERMIEAIKNKT